MAGHMDEDDDDDDSYADEVVDDWLPEDDPEPDLPKPPAKDLKPKIDIVRKSEYIVSNLDLYYALCEVDDWEFSQKEDWEQEIIMKTIMIEVYNPGENVILEGDGGNEFYIVIATEKTAHIAEIEVVNGNLLAGTEVFLTRLHRGQYFGQKYFITRRSVKRGATCRVPFDSLCSVHVAKVSADHFDKKQWCDFRNILLGRTVPLIQGLPRKERIQILQSLTIKEFKDKEFIIRQGEKGEECYIIQEGAVKVVESRGDPPQDHFLVTLREGHLFGEMSLVTDEPRVASVISVKTTICLCLTKQVFRGALSDKTFDDFLNEQLRKRQEIRKNREIANAEDVPPSSPAAVPMLGSAPSMRRMSYRKNKSFNLGEVKEVGTLNVRKLESGTKIINKYRIDRALGKGAFGEVYLCVDEETGAEYAMKQINRPQNRWNEDESNSIKLEIAVMKRMKHNNIVELHEVIDDQNARKIYLIQEYMEGGALMPDAETCTPISVTLARQYFRDIVRGVCYLHSEGIIHRDIKPQNMLLSKEGVVKIADFGAAAFTEMSAEKTAYGGTPAFMAPELFLTNTHIDFTKVEGIDVFALGATLYYLVVGRPPWMANNQIDLATKIKNIELTFPNDIIDPHLKHLLRQMLAKDYRTRCDLDSVVEDDWVTFEGSEPLFEEDDSFGPSWNDFSGGTAEDGRPVLKALLIDNSISKRKMLLQQLNSVRHVMCACVNNGDDAVEIIKVAVNNCPDNNFDVVFCELVSEDVPGCNTVNLIQESGFKGRIVGLVKHNDDLNAFLHHGAHVILRRPIAHREIVKLFAELDLFNESLASNAFKALSISAASADQAVSKEEVEAAITFSLSRAESSSFLKNAIDTRTHSSDEDDVEPKMEDFQNFRSIKSKRGSHEFELDDEQEQEESPDNTRLSFAENKSLSRKRGFMVVPYGGVAATSSGSDIEGGDRLVFDKPLKIFSINKAEDKRRERREAAMNKSKLAHQYREAKRTGGDIHSSKSLLTILKKQSSKRNLDRKNTRSFRDDISGLGSQRSIFTPGSGSTQQSRFSQYNTNNVSLRNIDTFIGNTVADCGSLDEEDEDNTEDVDFGLDDALLLDDDSDSDDNNNDSVVDDDDDDDDDDLADFGVGGDDIFQIDSSNAFDDLFAELIVKKPVDETIDIQVWNHIMVGSVMRSTLSCNDDQFDAVLGIRCGKSENIVGRSYMEDRSYANPTEPRIGQRCPLGLFSVFDGHNGDYVAVNLQNKYAPTYREFLEAYEERTDFTKPLDVTYESRIAQVFEDTCSLLDLEILEKDFVRQQKNLKSGIQDIQNFAGSVGVSLAIMPVLKRVGHKYSFSSRSGSTDHTDQSTTIQVFVSHVGDCRAVLCNDGVAVQLTEDHKANNKMEKLRIEAAGGWVHNGRVNGALGVSRSFGDIQFKNFDGTAKSAYGEDGQSGIWGRNQQVVSKPEFKHFVVENTYEFVVMASDGLWDVFSCQEAVNFVRQQLSSTNDLNKAADALIQKAIARGTQDNTSVIIIAFHQR